MDAAQRFLRDFGLTEREKGQRGLMFEALDGTDLVLRGANDHSLPMAVGAPTNAREIIWGVDSPGDCRPSAPSSARIARSRMGSDGMLRSRDDTGYARRISGDARHAL